LEDETLSNSAINKQPYAPFIDEKLAFNKHKAIDRGNLISNNNRANATSQIQSSQCY